MALDANDIAELELEFSKYLSSIAAECEQILRDAIYDDVYMSYDPKVYERNEQLLNNIDMEMGTDGAIRLFFSGLNYRSEVDGSDQSDNVPFYINDGHIDGTGINNMYHTYPKRHFMEDAAKKIRALFGVKVTILKDQEIVYVEE
jgi:hypothetical protein